MTAADANHAVGRHVAASVWGHDFGLVVTAEQVESILNGRHPQHCGDPSASRLVSYFSRRFHITLSLLFSSVSSVVSLEEAKVARGALYMQMPVQDVSRRMISRIH